jgi:pimeloyl-ACP methyl ester carboxylesterase
MNHPLIDLGGSGPLIHIAVANVFPPQTYLPIFDSLLSRYHLVSLPPRALWPGIGAPPQTGSWRDLADDLLNGLRQHNLTDVIAVGHSFGAIVSLLAALREPDRFRGLCLLDPTVFPPEVMRSIQARRQQGEPLRLPLIEGALARRREFANQDEAFAYWRGKGLFADWSDDALWRYTRSMTRPAADGLELVWSPEWEAYYYSTLYADTWDDLPALHALHLPTLVVQGEITNTFSTESLDHMRAMLPDAIYATIPYHGHLFPHSAPEATRAILSQWLEHI